MSAEYNSSDVEQPDEARRPSRGVYWLPNLFTTGTLFGGFYAIIAAIDGNFSNAGIAIFVAMIADGLDGRVARWTNRTGWVREAASDRNAHSSSGETGRRSSFIGIVGPPELLHITGGFITKHLPREPLSGIAEVFAQKDAWRGVTVKLDFDLV